MSDGTHIEWTDATWNPVTGCTMVSAGCTNCYAMGLAATRLRDHPSRAGLTRETGGRPVWTGDVRFNEQWLDQPLRWRRPRMIFVCAHGDLFHEAVPDAWIDRVFAVMALAPQHTFQVLTKRPDRMRAYLTQDRSVAGAPWDRWTETAYSIGFNVRGFRGSGGLVERPLPNVWLGVSVEDQPTADARIPHLLQTPAAVRFVSAEPLLGPMDLMRIPVEGGSVCALRGARPAYPSLDWVIAGGESGPGARPMHLDWARSLRDQCAAAKTAFFFKQWGEWKPLETEAEMSGKDGPPFDWRSRRDFVCLSRSGEAVSGYGARGEEFMRRVGKRAAGRLLDGRTHDAVPEERA